MCMMRLFFTFTFFWIFTASAYASGVPRLHQPLLHHAAHDTIGAGESDAFQKPNLPSKNSSINDYLECQRVFEAIVFSPSIGLVSQRGLVFTLIHKAYLFVFSGQSPPSSIA